MGNGMNRPPLESGPIKQEWSNWFTKVWLLLNTVEAKGSTAQRPTKNIFIGMTYFDTTLNKPIWVKGYTAGAAVWIDATGAVV